MTNKNFDFINEPGMTALRRSTPQMHNWVELQNLPAEFVSETPEQFRTELQSEPREFIPGLELDTRGVKDVLSPQTQARLAVLKSILNPHVSIRGIPITDPMPAFGRLVAECALYLKYGICHPAVTLSNSLDSFNRKAKKLGKQL